MMDLGFSKQPDTSPLVGDVVQCPNEVKNNGSMPAARTTQRDQYSEDQRRELIFFSLEITNE